MKNKLWLSILLLCSCAWAQVRITEICPKPETTDPNGREAGWIELTNTGDTEAVLGAYSLIRVNRGKADAAKSRLALPAQTLGAGERLLLWASELYGNKKIQALPVEGSEATMLVFPSKINPKKYPTVRLYQGETLVDSFDVPVDLVDGKSFGPGRDYVPQPLLDAETPYEYRAVGAEAWQSGGKGRLAAVADALPADVPDALAFTLSADSESFVQGKSVDSAGLTRLDAWDLSANENNNIGKRRGLTAPAETLGEATEAYTVAFWFKVAKNTEGTGNAYERVLFDYRPKTLADQTTDNPDKSGVLLLLTSAGQLHVQTRNAARTVDVDLATDTLSDYGDEAWHHVVLVMGRHAGDTLQLWVDGAREISTFMGAEAALRTDVPICFGRAFDSTTWSCFNGALADIRLYPRALEETEAARICHEAPAQRDLSGTLEVKTATLDENSAEVYHLSGSGATNEYLALTVPADEVAVGETVDFWVNPSAFVCNTVGSTTHWISLLDARDGNSSNDGFVLFLNASGRLYVERKYTAEGETKASLEQTDLGVTLACDRWTHLTLSYEASSGLGTLYVDGVKTQTIASAFPYMPPAGKHYFGGSRDSWWSSYQGALAAPRIFSGLLSELEVAKLHNASPLAESKIFVSGYSAQADTLLNTPTLTGVEGRFVFTLEAPDAEDRLALAVERCLGDFTATLDGEPFAPGSEIAAPGAGEHTLLWKVTPADEDAKETAASVSLKYLHTIAATTRLIFATPTPGEENALDGAEDYGPNIGPEPGVKGDGTGVTALSPAPPGEAYTVTYEIHPLDPANPANAIASVSLIYRTDFGEEKRLPMAQEGVLWSAEIPAEELPEAGHLLRYAAQIVDASGNSWRSPSFKNPDDGYAWFGTIVKSTAPTNESLQTFHLFADETALNNMDKQYDAVAASLPYGARVGVFDEQRNTYYDNVRIDLRGNTSKDFDKKSHGLRFSKCQPLTCTNPFDGEEIETRKTSFIAEYCDPTYIRQALSFWFFRQAGNRVPFDYPVQLQLNGAFYQLAFHSNRFTDELIEDYYGFGEEDGSVGYGYKNVGPFTGSNSATKIEKKTPDDGNEHVLTVLTAFTATLPSAAVTSAADQAKYTQRVVEAFDLPAWINYLAAARVTQEADDIWANLSAYYDSLHTDTWMPLAYDLNLSFGQWYYGDDRDYGQTGLRSNDDSFKSHPFFGGFAIRAHKKNKAIVGAANQALEALFQNEKFRRLYLRRLRTLMDAYLCEPGTSQEKTPLWQQAQLYRKAFASIVDQDRSKWAYASGVRNTDIWVWPTALSLDDGFTDLWDNFIVKRRDHLYTTHAADNTTRTVGYGADYAAGIPAAQSALATLKPNLSFDNATSTEDGSSGFDAAAGRLVIRNANDETVDLSGWTLSGAVVWTLPAGTVIDAQDTLTIVADRRAYCATLSADEKAAAPIILGNASFNTEALSLTLADATGATVCSALWAPYTAERSFLRVAEVCANSLDADPDGSEGDGSEFIMLVNTSESETLSLQDIRITATKSGETEASCDLTLTGGTLAPGETLRLDHADYRSAGWTKLTNNKVDMLLYDRYGAEIQTLYFESKWWSSTYGGGASLVALAYDTSLTAKSQWKPSFELPDDSAGATALKEALTATPAIGSWLAGLDASGQDALAAFTGSAADVETCYLVNIPLQTQPEVSLLLTGLTFDETGNLCLSSTLEVNGVEREGRVNGTLHLETFESLGGTPTDVPLDQKTFPLDLSSLLPGSARFFRLKLK